MRYIILLLDTVVIAETLCCIGLLQVCSQHNHAESCERFLTNFLGEISLDARNKSLESASVTVAVRSDAGIFPTVSDIATSMIFPNIGLQRYVG